LGEKFPKYGYRDMVEAQRRLLAEKFGITRVRLVVGTSMGCMHAWVWGTEHPGAVDLLMPLACQPAPITGRNLIWRQMLIDLLRQNPPNFAGARYLSTLMSSNPQELQARGATRDAALAEFAKVKAAVRPGEALDQIYQFESSRDYNPTPKLANVQARVYHVNFADDPINPPELGILPREMSKVPRGQWRILPGTPETHGHGTHTHARFWKQYLAELLAP
jgi:homoserine O-acetyltransferase